MFLLAIPEALAAVSVPRGLGGGGWSPGRFRGLTAGPGKGGGGSGKRAGASQDRGKSIPPHSPHPSMDCGGRRKTGRGDLCNPGLKLFVAYSGLSKFQVFIKLVLNLNFGILRIGITIRITVMMRMCLRCLAARRKRAAGRAAETWEARCRAGSLPDDVSVAKVLTEKDNAR